jgi:hypothetical protein
MNVVSEYRAWNERGMNLECRTWTRHLNFQFHVHSTLMHSATNYGYRVRCRVQIHSTLILGVRCIPNMTHVSKQKHSISFFLVQVVSFDSSII